MRAVLRMGFGAFARSPALAAAGFSLFSCRPSPVGAPLAVEAVPQDSGLPASLDAGHDAPSGLSPIPPEPLFTNLAVPGFPDAVVALPNGAITQRPVLVVIHGSGDRPDYNCDAWRHITSDYPFVLCPRGDYVPSESGKGDDKRYTHRGGAYLRRHVDAALASLATRFAGYVDVDRPALAGFSLGASEVAGLALSDPARFPRVAEIEGGHDVWTAANARAFAAGGGPRVLFGCGSAWCVPAAKARVARLQNGGLEARAVYANVGHTTDRPLQEAIMTEIGWFLAGDPRGLVSP
jgi:hypothetical protein